MKQSLVVVFLHTHTHTHIYIYLTFQVLSDFSVILGHWYMMANIGAEG